MENSQLLDKTFSVQTSEKKRQTSWMWAAINAGFLSLIVYDLLAAPKYREEISFYFAAELLAAGILALSFVTNVCTLIYHSWFTDKIICENESQRILLNISKNSFVRTPAPTKQQQPLDQNETINIRNLSYQTYSERKFSSIETLVYSSKLFLANSTILSSLHNLSWMSNTSGQSGNPEASLNEANSFQTPPKVSSSKFIMNRSGMNEYLKDVSQHEKAIAR